MENTQSVAKPPNGMVKKMTIFTRSSPLQLLLPRTALAERQTLIPERRRASTILRFLWSRTAEIYLIMFRCGLGLFVE